MTRKLLARIGAGLLLGAFLIVALPLAPVESAPPPKSVSEAVKPFADSKQIAGAVMLVADKNKVLALDAVGQADIASKRPMLIDAIFWIASMTKPITAAALMILVDEGKVNLDDPVEKYLPEFKNMRVVVEKGKDPVRADHPITVREVLSHTSGLLHISDQEKPYIDAVPLKDAVAGYTKTELLYQPSKGYQYSNAGINVAGRIVEVVSGMSFEEFFDKRLFGPLGMRDTTFWPNEAQTKRLATSYKPNKNKTGLDATTVTYLRYPLSERKNRFSSPGGGLFSTASDCGVFCQMVLNGGAHDGKRILSASAVKEMTSRQTPKDLKQSYGLGWAVSDTGFGHGGAYATNMWIDTKRGLVAIWMIQATGGYPGNYKAINSMWVWQDGGSAIGAFRKTAEELYAK